MKKLFVVMILVAFCGVAGAAVNQNNYGCGLGTMLLGDSGDTKLMQTLITTTNATTTNQWIGITLGIEAFGCTNSKWATNEAVDTFVQGNIDTLIRDVAAGQGESITSLASILEIEDVDAFGSKLQENFVFIFPSADVEYAHVANAIVVVANI